MEWKPFQNIQETLRCAPRNSVHLHESQHWWSLDHAERSRSSRRSYSSLKVQACPLHFTKNGHYAKSLCLWAHQTKRLRKPRSWQNQVHIWLEQPLRSSCWSWLLRDSGTDCLREQPCYAGDGWSREGYSRRHWARWPFDWIVGVWTQIKTSDNLHWGPSWARWAAWRES